MMTLTDRRLQALIVEHGSPLFVYSRQYLAERAREAVDAQLPFGHVVRYAIKANPHPEILAIFNAAGLHFDASSSYEAAYLLELGIAGHKISLSSQQSAHNLTELLGAGVQYVATSMHQLRLFANVAKPGAHVAIRVNPGIGSGHSNRVNTGGVTSGFGLWHEYLEEALAYAKSSQLIVDRLHVHIGSGADPAIWADAIQSALDLAARMPDVTTLDIGGGYKIARTKDEQEADMQRIAATFSERLLQFAHGTGRQLKLEIEPGTWLVGHAGVLLAEVTDITDTGKDGYTFLRVNTGMNDIIRPAMYGAQHDIRVINDATETADYVVIGHNCESSDMLTPAAGNPELIAPRRLNKAAIGDAVAIADTGAYCAAMSATGYNHFPSAKEVIV